MRAWIWLTTAVQYNTRQRLRSWRLSITTRFCPVPEKFQSRNCARIPAQIWTAAVLNISTISRPLAWQQHANRDTPHVTEDIVWNFGSLSHTYIRWSCWVQRRVVAPGGFERNEWQVKARGHARHGKTLSTHTSTRSHHHIGNANYILWPAAINSSDYVTADLIVASIAVCIAAGRSLCGRMWCRSRCKHIQTYLQYKELHQYCSTVRDTKLSSLGMRLTAFFFPTAEQHFT